MAFACKGYCKKPSSKLTHVSRVTDNISMCDPCGYNTLAKEVYCPCCGKKYRTRKTGKNASKRRLIDRKRI